MAAKSSIPISKRAYKKGKINALQCTEWRTRLKDFYDSEKIYLTKKYIQPHSSVLDIGGAEGGLGNAILTDIEKTVDYTNIDPDAECIKRGKLQFPKLHFINGFFPADCPKKTYDLVTMFALFPQIPDWKKNLLDMAKVSKKYINFSLLAKLEGTTVVDKDVSYFYYLDSGERVHQVVHNLYEIINFCSIHEMRAQRIHFFGYHAKAGNNNRGVANKDTLRANMLLELFPKGQYPGRVGGDTNEYFKKMGITVFQPEIEVIIDGKKFNLYE